jgi:hypothetical protein
LWPFHFQLRHTSIFFRPPLLMAWSDKRQKKMHSVSDTARNT